MTLAAALIGLIPFALLAASLLAGRYPGERALARAAAWIARARPTGGSSPPQAPLFLLRWTSGAAALALPGAGRGPPRGPLTTGNFVKRKREVMNRKTVIGAGALVAALAIPAGAAAHVTVQPGELPAGGFERIDVRVPNESEDAATDKVELQMPEGFLFVSYEPVDGWSTDVEYEKLDEPVEEHGEEITEQVDTVTWTAESPDAAIQPGQFQDFGLSVGMPSDAVAGDVLEFPAIQTYDDGEVVRWIEPPDSEENPAGSLTLTEGEEEHGAAPAEDEGADHVGDAEAAEDDGGSDGLAIAGLVAGGLGLIMGGTALARHRRNG
jgi:periplasmic copper chaperone A